MTMHNAQAKLHVKNEACPTPPQSDQLFPIGSIEHLNIGSTSLPSTRTRTEQVKLLRAKGNERPDAAS